MKRIPVKPRANLTRLLQSQGLTYGQGASVDSDPYWPDNRYYSFTTAEIELLEKAGKDVFDMCCDAAEYLVQHPEMMTTKMGIPEFAVEQIKESWSRDWGSIIARYDVCFGGSDHPDPRLRTPKFYEFNADTPTSIIESASLQWLWLEQTGHGNDQFSAITEDLIKAWKRNLTLIEQHLGHPVVVHFTAAREQASGEDAMNTILLMDACEQAGWKTKSLFLDEIALSPAGRFYDQHSEHIDVIFKLHPWEWIVEEEFGPAVFKDMANIGKRNERGEDIGGTIWIEPPYKLMWTNKAIFAIMWHLFKDDPRSKWLLPTYFEDEAPASLTKYARKPLFSRLGSDVVLRADGKVIQDATTGYYGKEGFVRQELCLAPDFKDEQGNSHFPVLGLWFVDGESAGLGVREDPQPITRDCSPFVPHSISDAPVNYERKPVPTAEEIEACLTLDTYVPPLEKESRDVLGYIERIVG